MSKTTSIAAIVAIAVGALAHGETLILDGLDQAQASVGQRPSRGMTMVKVTATWGNPVAKTEAVGKPPITRWDYADFTVYFEYDHVVHAVLKHVS